MKTLAQTMKETGASAEELWDAMQQDFLLLERDFKQLQKQVEKARKALGACQGPALC